MFYNFYNIDNLIGQQPVDQLINTKIVEERKIIFQIPWSHNIFIFTKSKNLEEAFFYLKETISNNWSRDVLALQIKSKLYERQAKAITNFKIPTPIGNYNPDWAIVFDKKDIKYIYFIAETKGSMDSMQLRATEALKIDYAKKHFEAIEHEELKYEVVTDYEQLISKVMR